MNDEQGYLKPNIVVEAMLSNWFTTSTIRSFRFIESLLYRSLLYRSPCYDTSAQSIVMTVIKHDDRSC